MKKITLVIAFIFSVIASFAQTSPPFPNNQSISNSSTLYHAKGGLTGDLGLVNARYPDTTTANNSYIAGQPGAQIIVGNTVYIRNEDATGWLTGTGTNPDTLNAIPGANISITGIYPNKTWSVTGMYTKEEVENLIHDSINNISVSNGYILNDSTFLLCNSGGCDTFVVQNISISSFTFTSDSTVLVCNTAGSCDTITFAPIVLNKFYVDSVKIVSGAVDTIKYFINGIAYVGGYVNSFIDLPDGRISGGYVSWTGSGLSYNISAATFKYLGSMYNTSDTVITLEAADATYSRIDLFALDTTNGGQVIKITGTPAPSPVKPQALDYQIELTTGITLNAGDTVPSNVSIQKIYDENIEWATAGSGGVTVNFNDGSSPFTGVKDALISTYSSIARLQFTRTGTGVIDGSEVLKMHIKLRKALAANNGIKVLFLNNSTPISSITPITANNGLDPNKINQYQPVAMPISQFTFTGTSYNRIIIYATGYDTSGTGGFYLDNIQLQTGINNIPNPADYSNKVDSTSTKKINDSTYVNLYWVKGLPYQKGDTVKIKSGSRTDSGAYHTATQGSDSLHFDLNRPNGTGTVFKFVFDTTNSGSGGTGSDYTLPTATASILGGVKIGSGLSIDGSGVVSATAASGWGLNGNSITSANFIGSTNNIPLYFKVNNSNAGWLSAAPAYNIAFGPLSLSIGTTGTKLIALGGGALGSNTTGYENVAGGYTSLYKNTTGYGNSAWGSGTLGWNTTGNNNTAVGNKSLSPSGSVNTVGNNNAALGDYALFDNADGNFNIGLGSYGGSKYAGRNPGGFPSNTLYISDSTYHMRYKLDSAVGTPPSVIGKDANGFWHVYQTPGGGAGSISRFGAEDHLGLENRNFILPDNTFTVQVGDTNVIDRYSRVNITKYGTSIQSTDSSQNYDVSMNVNSDGAQFNLYNSRSQIGRAYFQGVSNGNGVYMESDSIFYRTTRFSIYQLVPAITYTNSAQQVSKLVFPYFNDQTTKYSPLSVNGNYADASGNITISTGAGSAYIASNGLTMSGNDMQLGGTLLNNTTLTTGVYTLALTGTQTSLSVDVTANNTISIISSINGNNSTAIYGTAYGGSNVNSVGVKGNASNGIGGLFESSRYNSLDVNLPLEAGIYQDSSSIKPIFNLSRHKDQNFSDGTIVSNGFGGSLNFLLEAERDNLGNVDTYTANSLISKWTKTNPSDLSYTSTSEFQITGLLNNNIVTLLTLNGNGLIKLNQGLTNYANNAAAIAGGLTVGQLYRNGDIVQIVH